MALRKTSASATMLGATKSGRCASSRSRAKAASAVVVPDSTSNVVADDATSNAEVDGDSRCDEEGITLMLTVNNDATPLHHCSLCCDYEHHYMTLPSDDIT